MEVIYNNPFTETPYTIFPETGYEIIKYGRCYNCGMMVPINKSHNCHNPSRTGLTQ